MNHDSYPWDAILHFLGIYCMNMSYISWPITLSSTKKQSYMRIAKQHCWQRKNIASMAKGYEWFIHYLSIEFWVGESKKPGGTSFGYILGILHFTYQMSLFWWDVTLWIFICLGNDPWWALIIIVHSSSNTKTLPCRFDHDLCTWMLIW